ncbi:DUF3866 family protein [Desertibacillus haloalkaliphilus]|uniref:DUF3866 family protein n=1 Tax=Desertibacillus haloalkaliphilus TaxID=1328930 RepID=UPI001C25F9B9|nr:DUF3866 family protein [Desertibacillus haloalkaliphilus]MBU8907857.1 DUF3866 family protein [Desertibacillus haloalkaliphilus]
MYKELIVEVVDVLYEDEHIQLLRTSEGAKKAMLYRRIQPAATPGCTLLVNTTAVSLSLGTGGWDIVKAVLSPHMAVDDHQQGHIMKARYLPSQHSVLSVESQESADHSLFQQEFSLRGKKVLLAELHSMIPILFLTISELNPSLKMTVIISDEAALPLEMSSHLRYLREDQRFQTITTGQAFGGDYEAVNIPTALQFASEKLQSDVLIVSVGPGVVGTGTTYGFTGMALADWANTVGSFSGLPVWVPRISFADQRSRHQGISHHLLTPLLSFTYPKSLIPLPIFHKESWDRKISEQVVPMKEKHTVVRVSSDEVTGLIQENLLQYPIPITTMGRTFSDDPAFFLSVAVAAKEAIN